MQSLSRFVQIGQLAVIGVQRVTVNMFSVLAQTPQSQPVVVYDQSLLMFR